MSVRVVARRPGKEQARLEAVCQRMRQQVQRLEACLEATRARAEELATQQADEELLEHLEKELDAFAEAVREGLQRLVRLLPARSGFRRLHLKGYPGPHRRGQARGPHMEALGLREMGALLKPH